MSFFVAFDCADLGVPYTEVYEELAAYLEMPCEDAIDRFLPSEAIALVRYHRRQGDRRETIETLALELGIDAATVYTACTVESARVLLDALREKRSPAVSRVTRAVILPDGL